MKDVVLHTTEDGFQDIFQEKARELSVLKEIACLFK